LKLNETVAALVRKWRVGGYAHAEYPAIAEILEWQQEQDGTQRFLRLPQVHALETYWYLRLAEGTPHVFDLYRKLYPRQSELLQALGLDQEAIKTLVLDEGMDALWEKIKADDAFVHDFKLEALRETLVLDYPSYILALAMGAGKTVLIGAIIATEFAMSIEYPDGSFVRNALVFAPGKTIIESLRELAAMPFEKILPPRLYKAFAASVKLTFTRDGEKDIPIIRDSSFNVVVTNTEKIRIQKETIRKKEIGSLFDPEHEEEARAEVANLRLQSIASLPHLAIFSDEAHHTYGQSLDKGLKKVRKTVDYLAANTSLICVVNTTGTPYFKRQPLKDVVIWYGLSEGIRDDILKDLSGNIHAFDFSGDPAAYLEHVVKDFFNQYWGHCLPDGSPAKLAIYFPQTDDVHEYRPVIDQTLIQLGESPAAVLVNTSDSTLTSQADIDAFNRLGDPASPHRIILLVNKGTEGWNCPSLFACALARKLKSSNNFVLQAATRCLRQVPGNDHKASVYLSTDNFAILDRQLQETYGETIADLNHQGQETRRKRIILRKTDMPKFVMKQTRRIVLRRDEPVDGELSFLLPDGGVPSMIQTRYTLGQQHSTPGILHQVKETEVIEIETNTMDAYAAAVELVQTYRLDVWLVYDQLRRLYGQEDIPVAHLSGLAQQIEQQTCAYEVRETEVHVALALVKPEGFDVDMAEDGEVIYTAEIVYAKGREHLLLSLKDIEGNNPRNFGFHYTPYNFDSNPEKSFFEQMLAHLNLKPDAVEDIYFTGALTDPTKTDFFVEYKDDKGKWRRYTPDFVIRRKDGRVLIVETKREHDRSHPVDGEKGKKAMAMRRWEKLNPDRLKYEMIFTSTDQVGFDQTVDARAFVAEKGA